MFPDGSWMTAMPSEKFTGHMDNGACALCPKTGYKFDPDKFWEKTGYSPVDQRTFRPPDGRPPSPPRTNDRDDYDKYIKTKTEMLAVLKSLLSCA